MEKYINECLFCKDDKLNTNYPNVVYVIDNQPSECKLRDAGNDEDFTIAYAELESVYQQNKELMSQLGEICKIIEEIRDNSKNNNSKVVEHLMTELSTFPTILHDFINNKLANI